jgi:hypothetical protein
MWKVRIEIYWCLYKEIQEDRSVFWEVILSVIVKKNYTNVCLIVNGDRDTVAKYGLQ